MLLDPWCEANNHEDGSNNGSPQLDMQNIEVEASESSCADGGEGEKDYQIARHSGLCQPRTYGLYNCLPVILVECLAILLTSDEIW